MLPLNLPEEEMLFSRTTSKLLACLGVLLWAHIDGCMAFAAYQAASFKLAPQSYSQTAPAANDDDGAARLFDRNTASSFTPAAPALVDISLDKAQTISELRMFGSSPYLLTAQAQVNGQWQEAAPLKNLDLSGLGTGWHRHPLKKPVETKTLRLQLIPKNAASDSEGIREIELWSPGQQVPVTSGQALLALLDQGVADGLGRRYQAAPKAGVIGPGQDGSADSDSDNVFRFSLAYRPTQIKRAFLSYDLAGLAHWTGAIRSINEQAAMGGYAVEKGQGGRQIEPLDPAWLRQGANQIRFVPLSEQETYQVSNVQVLIELDNGTNFVNRVSSNIGRTAAETARLFDGDLSTGLPLAQTRKSMAVGWESPLWQQPAEPEEAEGAAAELAFNRLTDLTSVGFYPAGTFKGQLRVFLKKQGEWTSSAAGGELSFNKAGWQYLSVQDGADALGVRLVFEATEGKAELREISAAGSSLGSGDVPLITVSWPDAGQYFGDKIYVRGFAPADNGSGPVRLFAGRYELPQVNGEFEAVADTAWAENGTLELTVRYPDGTSAVSLIPLRQDLLLQKNRQIELRGFNSETTSEDKKQHIAANNSTSPASTVSSDVNLTEELPVMVGKDHILKFKSGAQVKIGKGALRSAVKIKTMTLRDRDMPSLDAGMINVTGKAKGFRFLPHGMKFNQKISVTLPYDKKLLPGIFKENDIRTYFFDEAAGHWTALERESADTAGSGIVSSTDHFTDMINAVVQVPESPENVSFNPTQIKDIKIVPPHAKINLIEPPQADSQGDARVSYPLEVPPGRKGMQPQLTAQYSSGGGDGWMGIGWDIPAQAVSIDTRWGVSRYDAANETETYTLNGQQLTPLAHRGPLVARTAEKVFHARTEGAFQKIIRHGSSPAHYWWEVIDKNGTHFFYGGDPAAGMTDDAVLKDYSGNIAKWALRTVQDSNGNTIRYQYVRQVDSGVGNGAGGVPGYELYLDKIAYTGYGSEAGPYTVTFLRDRQLGEARRTDVSIDARLGFKKVTTDLLRKIEVRWKEQLVRSYEFSYRKGAFEKTLLERVTQFDKDGKEFNRHQFDYYDEARNASGGYLGFGPAESWGIGNDNVRAGLVLNGEASALGGSETVNGGVHLYVGVGLGPKKDVSIGGKVGGSWSRGKGLLNLADINGDSLPDKVFGAGHLFRPNLSGPHGGNAFASPVSIGLSDLSREKSTMVSAGPEAYAGVTVGMNISNTFSETSAYLSDVNGDGISDLVRNSMVIFGRPDNPAADRPVPLYGSDSSQTPYPVGSGAVDGQNLLEDMADAEQEMLAASPLHDTLRRWTAPFSGTIRINGDVALIEDSSEERQSYTTADGVRLAIQHNGSELWAAVREANDYSPASPQGVEAIKVSKGDRIYFRVQSRFDGAYDQVAWNPEISYLNATAEPDANGLNPYVYQAGADFIPTGRTGLAVTLPATGTAALSGSVEIAAPCSDDIRVKVLLNDAEQFSQTAATGQTASIPVNLRLNVAKEDRLLLKIETDSPVDATKIRWQPHLEYTAAEGIPTLRDPEGKPVLAFEPPYVMDIYGSSSLSAPLQKWTAPKAGAVTVTAVVSGSSSGMVTLTAKKDGQLVGKSVLDLSKSGLAALPLTVAKGDKLRFELNTRSRELAKKISSSVTVKYADRTALLPAPSALNFPAEEGFFGQPYRGWTYAGYNGNGERASQPIIETDLAVPTFDQAQFDKDKQTQNPEELNPQFAPEKAKAVMFYPEPTKDCWRGYDDESWVKATSASSSRLGADYIAVPKAAQYAGAAAVSRLSRSRQVGVFAGGGPVSGSYTFGNSKSLLDFIDMNGDRFPDVVSSGGIQYSPMTGGLEPYSRPVLGGIRKTDTKAWSVGIGGNFAQIKFGGKGKQKDGGLQMPPLGISANFGKAGDEATYDLLDINGDGLPDKVFADGSAALNLGYAFAAPEAWGAVQVSSGDSVNLSGGLSAGYNDGLYGFGGGLNISRSEHKTKGALQDINGDGLPDYVRQGGQVLLNTGGGFFAALQYPGAADFAENASMDQGGGAYFTLSIPIPMTPISIIINPGADAGISMGRPEVMLTDIDGDGFPDHLASTKDSSLEVRRNQIGRTNLLRKVTRPLGASFTLEYERDGNTYQLPQSRWNLSRVAVFDGVAGDGADTLVSTYKYEDGFQHRQEREFFGYKTVTTEQRNAADNSVYRSTIQTFLNRNYYEKGLLVSEVTQDGEGRKYLETLNSYQLRDVGSGKVLEGALKDSLAATVFPELSRTDKRFYEGQAQPGISTYQTFEYDALGNVTHFFDAADAGAEDDVESFIGYHSDLASYIVGKADRIEVKSNGKLLRQREAVFEAGTGNLRQVRLSFGTGTAVHDFDYDQYGNIVRRTGPANSKGQRYSLSYTYDPDVHTYVVQSKDSFGYSSSAAYDLKWGEITRSTDLNKQAITYRYDSVGRAAGITGPYQQGTGRETLVFAYHPEAKVPWALTQHFDNYQQKTDPIETVLFTDGLKRELQTKKDGAVSTGGANKKDVMLVSGRVIFDFAGRVIEQYYPVTENLGSQGAFNASFDSVPPTKTRHDVLDRVLQTTLPDGTGTTFAYGFGQDRDAAARFETTVTDANNKSKVTFKDVGEHITSVKEFNQGRTLWTSYEYDPIGQIVLVKDAKDNLTKVGYDLMGRRTAINSPDAGLTEYVYDPASNLTKKITANLRAKGKAIQYDYSYNRLDKIVYPEFTGNNVSYSYGAPGAAFNRAGRIVSVKDESGSEERFYGPLGETVKTIKQVASSTQGGSANAPEIYVSEYTYDTYNRLRRLIWPDGEVLTYAYNSGGLADSATGSKGSSSYPYLKALTYDKFEQRAYMQQGNGAETKYSYNPLNRRLAALQAKAAGRQFMDLSYGYDLVGNILQLDNLAPVAKPNQFGGKTKQQFGYDDLYRLTKANGSLLQQPNTERRYTLAMQYDDIHNIVAKNQNDVRITPSEGSIEQHKTTYDYRYAYTGQQPHAPTQIGDRAFSYDANGNQTGWESTVNGTRRRIVWDEENRIQEILDNGHSLTYAYNDAGERVFKNGPQGETAYVSQFYSVRNREAGSKHVFIGTGRIATKLVKGQENVTTAGTGKGNNGGGSGGGSNGKGTVVYEKDIYYYHPDHLGSSTFISAIDGDLYQHLENFPFGETWIEEATNTQRTPYHFTAKELDEETGLYYFGARYYDPRTSVWQSPDPILAEYLPTLDKENDNNLPSIGGVFTSFNLSLNGYSKLNPLVYVDRDGEKTKKVVEMKAYEPPDIPFMDKETKEAILNGMNSGKTFSASHTTKKPLTQKEAEELNTTYSRSMFATKLFIKWIAKELGLSKIVKFEDKKIDSPMFRKGDILLKEMTVEPDMTDSGSKVSNKTTILRKDNKGNIKKIPVPLQPYE